MSHHPEGLQERQREMPGGMTAITQAAYGASDSWACEQVEVPFPGKGQVLVRVRAAGLSRGT